MTIDWNKYPNFSEAEMACPCCGKAEMDADFMSALQHLRNKVGFAFRIVPGGAYRCKVYTEFKGYGPEHSTGKAVDIVTFGEKARRLVEEAHPFPRIGVKQTGPVDRRFIHLGYSGPDSGLPSPWIWSY